MQTSSDSNWMVSATPSAVPGLGSGLTLVQLPCEAGEFKSQLSNKKIDEIFH